MNQLKNNSQPETGNSFLKLRSHVFFAKKNDSNSLTLIMRSCGESRGIGLNSVNASSIRNVTEHNGKKFLQKPSIGGSLFVCSTSRDLYCGVERSYWTFAFQFWTTLSSNTSTQQQKESDRFSVDCERALQTVSQLIVGSKAWNTLDAGDLQRLLCRQELTTMEFAIGVQQDSYPGMIFCAQDPGVTVYLP